MASPTAKAGPVGHMTAPLTRDEMQTTWENTRRVVSEPGRPRLLRAAYVASGERAGRREPRGANRPKQKRLARTRPRAAAGPATERRAIKIASASRLRVHPSHPPSLQLLPTPRRLGETKESRSAVSNPLPRILVPVWSVQAEMGIFGGTPPPSCPSSRHCAEWARIYLKYCLCSPKDGVALTLGLLSVISWGVAEVPQIITNYRQKSTEGLSIAFLMTWIVGDLFNLVGCFLEPATLPTQFYMALLYTVTTVVLTGQTIYYSHIYHRLKAKKSRVTSKLHKHQRGDASLREKLLSAKDGGASRNNSQSDATVSIPSLPIPVNGKVVEQDHCSSSPSTDFYYMSARSLSRSPVPTAGIWLGNNRQSSRTPPQMNDQRECLSGEIAPSKSVPTAKNVLSVVPWMSLLFAMCVLHFLIGNTHMEVPSGTVIPVGRRLLLFTNELGHSSLNHGSESGIGSFLGWAMAIIYMGGRLPQIFLNMQRGHAEGLNPLMFTFALVGNSTYVGSILVNSLDWSKLRPNLPWLVDAGGCVLLDFFIILQFLYFHYRKQSEPADVHDEHDNADKA